MFEGFLEKSDDTWMDYKKKYELVVLAYCDVDQAGLYDKFEHFPCTILQQFGQEVMIEFDNMANAKLFAMDFQGLAVRLLSRFHVGMHITQVDLEGEDLAGKYGAAMDIVARIAHCQRESGIYVSTAFKEVSVVNALGWAMQPVSFDFIKERDGLGIYRMNPDEM